MPGLPSKFDREQLDRILKRAADLQAGEADPGEALTKDELLQLGRDVGIPAKFLEQAALEEQTRAPVQVFDGFWDKVMGPASVSAMRVVRGNADQLERSLIDYMEEEELLAVARQTSGRIAWEPLKGFNAAMKRSRAVLGGGNKPFMLARAVSVAASATPLETGFVHVAMEADLHEARGQREIGILATSGVGLVGAGVVGVLVTPLLSIVAIALSAIAIATQLRSFAPVVQRTQMGLERALDQLERGVARPPVQIGPGASIVGAVLDEVRKAISSR
jgi:hypothetical protein